MGWNQITSGLYVGDIRSINDPKLFRKIKAVVSCVPIDSFPHLLDRSTAHLQLDLLDYPGQDMSDAFKKANRFIYQQHSLGRSVLVHCHAGVSRSVSIVIAYLMQLSGKPYQVVAQIVKRHRPEANPNSGFQSQLQRLSKQLGRNQN